MFQKPSPDIALSNPSSSSAKPHQDDVETVVGPSVIVEGDFASDGNILVKGTVLGSVKTSQRLTVEKGARILANVRAGDAFIAGEIKGNVKVNDRLEFTATARVEGDVQCGVLVIEAGALMAGKISMKGIHIESPKSDKKSQSEKKSTETTA